MTIESHLSRATKALGSIPAVVLSVVLIVGWGFSGPLFGFSDTWQLVINTTTTIVTFLMVFVIQNTQNRDGMALQAKLDAILATLDPDHENPIYNKLIGLENEPENVIAQEQKEVVDQCS